MLEVLNSSIRTQASSPDLLFSGPVRMSQPQTCAYSNFSLPNENKTLIQNILPPHQALPCSLLEPLLGKPILKPEPTSGKTEVQKENLSAKSEIIEANKVSLSQKM